MNNLILILISSWIIIYIFTSLGPKKYHLNCIKNRLVMKCNEYIKAYEDIGFNMGINCISCLLFRLLIISSIIVYILHNMYSVQ